ncbi:unnamed protein product [Mytilus edulis]|uniref:Endonuclease/exonuclease/phosphatase domain-containing protein n=1 Tax=Mytilus edulis TaxID=6550 RepID=A0A8S3RZ62_MYTED|nr:unnamed protein product [Mytilus edulis]
MTMLFSTLKMCTWNVGGLFSGDIDKTQDKTFIDSISKYDLAFLVETHVGYNSNIKNVGPFNYYPVCRPITKANNRYYGGIAILRKPHIKDHVKILKNSNTDYQWVKLEKKFFGFHRDLYICVIYYPPVTSTYTKKGGIELFECLENDITLFCKDADILLCGDFNARAGSHPDLIIQDEIDFLPLYNTYPLDKNIMLRKNRDKKLDCRGKDLCEFCISHQLRILNGRTLGDLNGNFTCYTPNGASVVDYSIVSESALDYILYFRVAEFVPTLSDCHCKIEWEMSAQFSANLRDDCIDHDLHTMPSRYMWSENSVTVFQEALTSPSVLEKISDFILKGHFTSKIEINEASVKLTNIFIEAAEQSLKKTPKYRKNKKKHKNFFDSDLHSMRKNLINYGKIYSSNPKDPMVKNHYYKLYREYNKCRKTKRKFLRQIF